MIGDDHPATTSLIPLATFLDVSPYGLSRAFPREMGVSLTRYRNRVRITRALDHIETGEPNPAVLAADVGSADSGAAVQAAAIAALLQWQGYPVRSRNRGRCPSGT